MKKIITFGLMALASQLSTANEISLAISDELVELRMESNYEQDFFGRFAYMHADSNGVDSDQLSYTFGVEGKIDRTNVMLGLRPYWIDAENETAYGLALGLGGSTEIVSKLTVGAEIFYAPEILTGGDVDDSLDMEVRLSYQLIENGAIFGGYREIELDADVGDVDVYDSFFLGVALTF